MDSLSNPRILITGASGFLGRNLLKRMESSGFHVSTLSLEELSRAYSPGQGLSKSRYLDLAENYINDQVLADLGVIVHAATCYGRNDESEEFILYCNYQLPKLLLEHAIDSSVSLFINIDTSLPSKVNSYSYTKYLFENYAKKICKSSALNTKFLNIQLERVYGEGQSTQEFIPWLILQCLRNESVLELTSCDQVLDFIHIEDVSRAITLLIQSNYSHFDPFVNIELGSGIGTELRTVVEIIQKLTKSSSLIDYGAKPPRQFDKKYSVANNEFMRRLKWEPEIEINQGLDATVRQIRSAVQEI